MNDNVAIEALDVEDRDRFTMVYDDVWHALKGKSAFFVYMALKRRTNPDNKQWHGTYKNLSEEAGVSVSTFRRGVEKLQELGLVTVHHRFVPSNWDGKDQKQIVFGQRDEGHPLQIGNLYRVRFHMPQNVGAGVQSEQTPPPQSEQTPPPQNEHQTEDTQYIDTQDIETRGSSGDERDDSSGDFQEFWKAYPRKKGTKSAVEEIFNRVAKDVGPGALILGAENFAAECKKNNTQDRYICYPSTFLNQGRWKDYQGISRGRDWSAYELDFSDLEDGDSNERPF